VVSIAKVMRKFKLVVFFSAACGFASAEMQIAAEKRLDSDDFRSAKPQAACNSPMPLIPISDSPVQGNIHFDP